MEYGCIAEKLSHSFSKEIHANLFDYDYKLVELPPEQLDLFFINRDFKAINVTIPYKEKVIKYLDAVDEAAAGIGAVNTIINRGGKLYGYNTDLYGMCLMIRRNKMDLSGKKVLILGSGGTSKTAYAASKELGAGEIIRVSRTEREGCISYAQAVKIHSDAEAIINTTPCGMYPNIGESAIDISGFNDLKYVVDVVYNPLRSKLVVDSLSRGITACGGLYMLVAQAALAAEKFTGSSVASEKIEEIYRRMLKRKENIVLIGMPGSGKTTVGRIISEKIGMEFTDTDEEIKTTAGCDIPRIFASKKESGFRDLETEVIKWVSLKQHSVIATGGGAVTRDINIDLLRENGMIFFIDRPLSELPVTADRPLSSSKDSLKRLYDERCGLYLSACDVHIKDAVDVSDVSERIMEAFFDETACD